MSEMTCGQMMALLVESAKRYRKHGIMAAVKRDKHMNDYTADRGGVDNSNALAEAVLVSFINFMAGEYHMDYALYTRDLKDGPRCWNCFKDFVKGKPSCDCVEKREKEKADAEKRAVGQYDGG